jgi:site-specific DNA-methyltransferase (adenine-specific)
MQLNKIYNEDWINNKLPDKSVQLIIADPPYFEVKGEFDFIWKSFDDYLQDVENWAKECKRILADNGTLFWYGHAKKIAYSQVILDKYFNLENSLVWEKKNCQTMKCSHKEMRTFAPVTERLLMYSNGLEPDEWDNFNENVSFIFQPILDWFLSEWQKSGLTRKQVDEACKTKNVTQYWFLKRNYQIPTEDKYKILQYLSRKAFLREYEDLRREYEDLRRPFDNRGILQKDVLKYSQETHITKNYEHDTKKPETLTRQLILTCSRPNDLVFVPFVGSGTECAMAVKENRNFIGYDINLKYCNIAKKRILPYLQQQKLF